MFQCTSEMALLKQAEAVQEDPGQVRAVKILLSCNLQASFGGGAEPV
jgi:hypothetical protein